MNDSPKQNPERARGVNSRALSSTGCVLMLIVHGLAGLVLLAILAWFARTCGESVVRLHRLGELPDLTEFVVQISPYLLWLLPSGFAVDAAVLYALRRLPGTLRWLAMAWFSLVLIGMLILDVVTSLGILDFVLRITTTV